MSRPHVLITNDDGIDSYFLRVLVESHLAANFQVSVAAPLSEQSWIGRAFSRHREVHVARVEEDGFAAWAIDGTPADCVNIALGHLLPERPDAVVSGINIGFNATMPLCLSSGTLAGAIEGAGWGIPALAFSLELPDDEFESIRLSHGKAVGATLESLRAAAARAADFTRAELAAGQAADTVVHNVNFPKICRATTPVEKTVPANLPLGSLYRRETPTSFCFRWHRNEAAVPRHDTDLACLARGNISHSVLNYSALGRAAGDFRK